MKPLNNNLFDVVRSEMDKVVHLSTALSCLLLLLRIVYADSGAFIFLLWNLFLAYIPYLITSICFSQPAILENRYKLIPLSMIWILMIPNSFYIVTDLFHLHAFSDVPRWFDLLLLFSFAWNGLILGMLSIQRVELLLRMYLSPFVTNMLLLCMMWLNALGVYIGRYYRFNSWDIVSNPHFLFSELGLLFTDPIDNKSPWAMTFFFGILLFIIYTTLRKLSRTVST